MGIRPAQLARVALGFIFAPAVGLSALAVVLCALATETQSFSECLSGGESLFLVWAFGGLFAYPVAILLGVPLLLVFRKKRWLGWWQVTLGGFVTGILSTVIWSLFAGVSWETALFMLLFCGVGVMSALAFWAIAVFRNAALTHVR